MTDNLAHAALVLTGLAALGTVLAWLILSTPTTPVTRPAHAAPSACGVAVEAAQPDGSVPPAPSGSGAPTAFGFQCGPCGGDVYLTTLHDVVEHLRSHEDDPADADHFAAWEREFASEGSA